MRIQAKMVGTEDTEERERGRSEGSKKKNSGNMSM